jgi:hypothetical protein
VPSRILPVALAATLAALAFSPAAESAGSLAHRVAVALKTARAPLGGTVRTARCLALYP